MVALKLARFKQIFPGAAKTDRLDARKILELFQVLILGTKFKTCPPKKSGFPTHKEEAALHGAPVFPGWMGGEEVMAFHLCEAHFF